MFFDKTETNKCINNQRVIILCLYLTKNVITLNPSNIQLAPHKFHPHDDMRTCRQQ